MQYGCENIMQVIALKSNHLKCGCCGRSEVDDSF